MDPKSSLVRFIRFCMRDVRYHKQHVCTVVSQDSAGLLALRPDDETIGGKGLSAIPIRHGLPGCKVFVRQGARVLLGYENGDPERPYASVWSDDPDVVVRVELPGDRRPIAR